MKKDLDERDLTESYWNGIFICRSDSQTDTFINAI